MKKIVALIACSAAVLMGGLSYAAEIYVDGSRETQGNGSKSKPLNTIQAGINRAKPGDTVVIAAGVYREAVKFNKKGTASQPIRIQARGKVRIDGTEVIDGKWTQHKGNIYKTKLTGPKVEQAFLKSTPLVNARWPNATFADTWDRSKWAKASKGAKRDTMVCKDLAATEINWTGATAVLNVGHQFKTWTRPVLKHKKGSEQFSYLLDQRMFESGKWEDDRFYLTGTIKALDAPGEFFHDEKTGWFYYVTENGKAPEQGSIAVKVRDFGFRGAGNAHVHIEGLEFYACTMFLANASHVRLKDLNFLFPAFRSTIGENNSPKMGKSVTPAFTVSGENNTIDSCSVAYASGAGIVVRGAKNKVMNCLVHDVNWSGTINFPGIQLSALGEGMAHNLVQNCTVYNVGNIGIDYRGMHTTIENNLVHHAGLACHDIAGIHTGSPVTEGCIVRNNIVHNVNGKGIRGDDQTRGITICYNLVYHCKEGIIAKGNHNKVYHNTIIGYGKRDVLTIPTREEPDKFWTKAARLKVQNLNSLFFNNYVGKLEYRYKPIPQNKGISDNVVYKKGGFKSELINASLKAMEAGAVDAMPKQGSSLIDKGRIVRGVNDQFEGKRPDIGAFEFGREPWKAGSSLSHIGAYQLKPKAIE